MHWPQTTGFGKARLKQSSCTSKGRHHGATVSGSKDALTLRAVHTDQGWWKDVSGGLEVDVRVQDFDVDGWRKQAAAVDGN